MKKTYIQPQFEIVNLMVSTSILSGSVRGDVVSVSETNYNPNEGEDY